MQKSKLEFEAETAIKLDNAAHHGDRWDVLFTAEGFEHADEIAGARDIRSQAFAEG